VKWTVAEEAVEAATIVAVRRHVTFGIDVLGPLIGELFGELYGALPGDAGSRPGNNVIAYVPVGDRTADMLVGRHWTQAAPEGLELFHLPSCRAAHTTHVGPYQELPAAHQAVHAWLRAEGQREVGLNWEVYGDWDDDPAKLVTDVYYLRLPAPG
jgi:effector-binding domain-containing protein